MHSSTKHSNSLEVCQFGKHHVLPVGMPPTWPKEDKAPALRIFPVTRVYSLHSAEHLPQSTTTVQKMREPRPLGSLKANKGDEHIHFTVTPGKCSSGTGTWRPGLEENREEKQRRGGGRPGAFLTSPFVPRDSFITHTHFKSSALRARQGQELKVKGHQASLNLRYLRGGTITQHSV